MGDIRQQVAEAGLKDNVYFLGNRDDIPALLMLMDVFVLPSNFEGLPLVVVEAQASGLPWCWVSDRVTKEVALTGLLDGESLNEGPQCWAREVRALAARGRGPAGIDEVRDAGYDLLLAGRTLTYFYVKRAEAGHPLYGCEGNTLALMTRALKTSGWGW